MKILFYGDSITDAGRDKQPENSKSSCLGSYGRGYPIFIAEKLYSENPQKYEILNRGISGNRVVDLYARIKADVWNLEPDVLSILIGVNDVWHEISSQNGVEIERFDKIYRMLIEDTQKRLPNLKIVLCEPFVLKGVATHEEGTDRYERFCAVYDYAKVVKKIAKDYGLYFLPLQDKFNEMSVKYGAEHYLSDGVHPMVAGANLIAEEWVKLFKEKIEEK